MRHVFILPLIFSLSGCNAVRATSDTYMLSSVMLSKVRLAAA